MTPFMNATLWFVGIVALIPLVLWLLKRSPLGGGASTGPLRQVASLTLSAQQRLVTVEVGRGDDRLWLVLGVTPQNIQVVHTMAPETELPPTGATPSATFAHLLQRMRQDGDGHAR